MDVKITGKYEEEAAESYREVLTGQEEVEDVTIGGLTNKDDPLQLCGETEDTDEEESDDDGDGASNSRSRRDRPDKAAEEAAMEDNIHSKDPIPYSLFESHPRNFLNCEPSTLLIGPYINCPHYM